jgi:uncharacterized protein (DUF2062 family)
MKSSPRNPNDVTRTGQDPTDSSQRRIRRSFRYFYNRYVRLHGSPREIAWGAALGFFIAMTPTMGIQMYIAIPLAAVFRISKVAAATTVWLTNPLTAPFIYGFTYMAGAKLLGYPLKISFTSDPSWQTLWDSGKCVLLALTVGGIISGVVVGAAGYFLTLSMVTAAREKAHRLKMRHKKGE